MSANVAFIQEHAADRAVLAEGSAASQIIMDGLNKRDVLSIRRTNTSAKQIVRTLSPTILTSTTGTVFGKDQLAAIINCATRIKYLSVSASALTTASLAQLSRVDSIALVVPPDGMEEMADLAPGEILRTLASQIVKLDLEGYTPDSALAADLVKLHTLSLSNCDGVDAFLLALASPALAAQATGTNSGTGSTSQAAAAKTQAVRHLSLEEVDVTPDGLEAICRGLETLTLGSCPQLSEVPACARAVLRELRLDGHGSEKLLQSVIATANSNDEDEGAEEEEAESTAAQYPILRRMELSDCEVKGALPQALTSLHYTAATHKCSVLQSSWFKLCKGSIQEIDIVYGDTYDPYAPGGFVAADFPSLTRLSFCETNTRSGWYAERLESMLASEGKKRVLRFLHMDERTVSGLNDSEDVDSLPSAVAYLGIPYLFVPLPKHWEASELKALLMWNSKPPAEMEDAGDDEASEEDRLGDSSPHARKDLEEAPTGEQAWVDTGYLGGPIMPAKGEPLRVLDVRGSTADLSEVLLYSEGVQYLNIARTAAVPDDIHPTAKLIRLTCTLKVPRATAPGAAASASAGKNHNASLSEEEEDESVGLSIDELLDYVSFTPSLRFLCVANDVSHWRGHKAQPARDTVQKLYQRLCSELPTLTDSAVTVKLFQAGEKGDYDRVRRAHPDAVREDPQLLESPTVFTIEYH